MDTKEITPDDNREEAAEVTEEVPEPAENAESNEEEAPEAVEADTDETQTDEIEDDFAVDGDDYQETALEAEEAPAEAESKPEEEQTAAEAPAEEPKEKKPNPALEKLKELKKLPWKRIGKIAGAVASVLAVIYFIGVWFYSSHFAYNTALKIFECPNMTVEEAEAKIKSGFGDYRFYIFERDNKVESISGQSIDLKCVSVTGVQEALERQNPFAWPFPTAYQDVNITVDFNADKLYHEAEKLDCFAQSIKDMDGAYAGVYYQDGVYHMREMPDKNAISFEKLYSALYAGIKNVYRDMSLEQKGIYVLMADEDNLRHAMETMNKYVATVVTYTRGTDTFVIDGGTINQWVSINPDCTVVLSNDGIAKYVNELAAVYNTVGASRQFKTSGGGTITVSGGDYGWEINKANEIATLRENILNGDVISREPALKKRENGFGLTNTYAEVSIAAQTMWYYKDGALALSTPVVTGNPLQGNGTHTGVYSVKYKEKDAVLRGDDYETPVKYWMPFNGGEGFHDATWRGRFGGAIYRGGGSHGCVNMPYSAAEKLFSMIASGTPVIVY